LFKESEEDFFEESANENLQYEEDDEEIVDKALNFDEIPQTTNEFSPYFENITSALLFCWMQKHNICKILFISSNFYIFLELIII